MDIFFAISDNYADKLAVTIVSLLENNHSQPIHLNVLSSDISSDSCRLLQKVVRRYPLADINFINIDASRFAGLKLNIDYISLETYFRYLISEVCPHLDKALYLDADLVINKSLDDLWNTDLEEYMPPVSKTVILRAKIIKPRLVWRLMKFISMPELFCLIWRKCVLMTWLTSCLPSNVNGRNGFCFKIKMCSIWLFGIISRR